MKITQKDSPFSPVTLVLETKKEAITFFNMALVIKKRTDNEDEFLLVDQIVKCFRNEIKF